MQPYKVLPNQTTLVQPRAAPRANPFETPKFPHGLRDAKKYANLSASNFA